MVAEITKPRRHNPTVDAVVHSWQWATCIATDDPRLKEK
jgi:hypothetical protein